MSPFRPTAQSWIAIHPNPKGVVEFIGGALYGLLPTVTYAYFLQCLYREGYTVIAVPFPFGFNHGAIALSLLQQRQQLLAEFPQQQDVPRFWIGHSLGCKYIMLLESSGLIMNQPSILIAPDISDTKDALPGIPKLPTLLDRLGLGVKPTRRETQTLVSQSPLFNLTALISFASDTIAGSQDQDPETSDVAWMAQQLKERQGAGYLGREIPGGHREPVGLEVGDRILRPDCKDKGLQRKDQRYLETITLELLDKLAFRM